MSMQSKYDNNCLRLHKPVSSNLNADEEIVALSVLVFENTSRDTPFITHRLLL